MAQVMIPVKAFYVKNCPELINIFDGLYNLVPFVQFKIREKYPWRSVNFSEVAG